MEFAGWLTTTLIVVEALIRVALAGRVLMRRLPTAVTMSWLVLVLLLPIIGVAAYLLIGESRIGKRREHREQERHPAFREYLDRLCRETENVPSHLSATDARLSKEAEAVGGFPLLSGNDVRLIDTPQELFDETLALIDGAEDSLLLEFFIWWCGGRVDAVEEALIRAAKRGVACRVLVDAVGSRDFIRSRNVERLRAAGVRVTTALPPRLLRTPLLRRVDHRNHRKLIIVDDGVALVGSMNMADPDCFKTDAGVGPWVDLAAVVRGPVVEALSLLAIRDWETEDGEDTTALRESLSRRGPSVVGEMPVQVVPSGPGYGGAQLQSLVLAAIYEARERLVLTTPYFVPDQAVLTALQTAARCGAEVTLIVPVQGDSKLAHFAGRAFFIDLLEAGVRIAEYHGGLLHTKCMVVDDEVAMFGTANIDPRSFWLNFELTMMIYDNRATQALFERQQGYLEDSTFIELEEWRNRSLPARIASNIAQLFSPML